MLTEGLVKKEIEQWNMYQDYQSQVNLMQEDKKRKMSKKWKKAQKAAAYENLLADLYSGVDKIIGMKVEITESIYMLIQSICKDNRENEKYTYKLLHNFLFQA